MGQRECERSQALVCSAETICQFSIPQLPHGEDWSRTHPQVSSQAHPGHQVHPLGLEGELLGGALPCLEMQHYEHDHEQHHRPGGHSQEILDAGLDGHDALLEVL
jgi:hypothetical protein